jgi:hypothetical protein
VSEGGRKGGRKGGREGGRERERERNTSTQSKACHSGVQKKKNSISRLWRLEIFVFVY